MARTTLSSLVSFFVVLLLVVTTSKANDVYYRLVNADDYHWAKNFPPSGGRPPFFSGVIVDGNFASVYERWIIERFEEGYTIQNAGSGFWLTARDGEVWGASEFNKASSKWYIERGGEGKFKISKPNADLVITARHRQPDYPLSLFLEPADGTYAQLWSLERVD